MALIGDNRFCLRGLIAFAGCYVFENDDILTIIRDIANLIVCLLPTLLSTFGEPLWKKVLPKLHDLTMMKGVWPGFNLNPSKYCLNSDNGVIILRLITSCNNMKNSVLFYLLKQAFLQMDWWEYYDIYNCTSKVTGEL